MKIGDTVKVTSLVGVEFGVIHSINYNANRALVYFDYADCPHFDSFTLNQVEILEPYCGDCLVPISQCGHKVGA